MESFWLVSSQVEKKQRENCHQSEYMKKPFAHMARNETTGGKFSAVRFRLV